MLRILGLMQLRQNNNGAIDVFIDGKPLSDYVDSLLFTDELVTVEIKVHDIDDDLAEREYITNLSC
jgi:hypothetical protein